MHNYNKNFIDMMDCNDLLYYNIIIEPMLIASLI
jgi:hypothetical protein